MKEFYKVNVYSEYANLDVYNTKIIVSKGWIYATELFTNTKIMICDNKAQGCFHYYYVLSSDFNLNNIVRYDEISYYMENFQLDKFPIYTKLESKKVKTLMKRMLNKNIKNKDIK